MLRQPAHAPMGRASSVPRSEPWGGDRERDVAMIKAGLRAFARRPRSRARVRVRRGGRKPYASESAIRACARIRIRAASRSSSSGSSRSTCPARESTPGSKYDVVWEDYTSGPPITSQMLAGKLDIGVMGDYPLLVNLARFQETNSLRSVIVSMTGYNMHGSGNSIVVPADAPHPSLRGSQGQEGLGPVRLRRARDAPQGAGRSRAHDGLLHPDQPGSAHRRHQHPGEGRSTRTPTSVHGASSWSSRASGGRSSTEVRRRSPICTARSSARTSSTEHRRSSWPI